MQEKKETGLIISIIIVLVLVVAIIVYAVMHVPTASDSSQVPTSTSVSNTTSTNQSNQNSMSSNDSASNLQKGQDFLAANAKQPGVTVLPDGLQYKVIKEGTGPKPTASQQVTVNYEGTLIDGTIFDSSYKRGQPLSFGVNQVIKGWTEALQLMPVGSTWMLYIPSDLAYGAGGAPGSIIGPNATLIFKVELISAQ